MLYHRPPCFFNKGNHCSFLIHQNLCIVASLPVFPSSSSELIMTLS
uniref:Uncharacterized protein n=1 Tax=Arundo donax TaxID=35708 RepID=A0A0A9GRC1_ARUDO